MNTPDTLVILVTQDTGQRQTKQNKENHTENYKDRLHGTHQKKPGVNTCACEIKQLLFLIGRIWISIKYIYILKIVQKSR
jgi:hypothetical protein